MDYYDPRRRALRAVRQLLYPRECPFCGRVLGESDLEIFLRENP